MPQVTSDGPDQPNTPTKGGAVSKFNVTGRPAAAATSPIITDAIATAVTYEGASGYARDAKSELFLLAVSNMVGENTFYEAAGQRDARFAALVRALAVTDPDWTARLIGWLRNRREPAVGRAGRRRGVRVGSVGRGSRRWQPAGDRVRAGQGGRAGGAAGLLVRHSRPERSAAGQAWGGRRRGAAVHRAVAAQVGLRRAVRAVRGRAGADPRQRRSRPGRANCSGTPSIGGTTGRQACRAGCRCWPRGRN